ncbi:hypothetical protein [Fluviispira multicolorata]|uniref:Uncharacterized protein n=1 Tax=Fluviispira multicolorata TaxID=2654512 RepID=A0A833JAP2_9BACT|nr:hypothetical protein [Fluviispira multicolorata]KAB8028081.1 hypothetical protein GCL57_13600 [Fluviispira multicolorata]
MLYKKLIVLIFFTFSYNANALKVEPFDNFIRFHFSSEDFISNAGIKNNSFWHYPGYDSYRDCALATVPIYLTKKAHLIPYLEIKSTAFAWIKDPSDIFKINTFHIKTFSENSGYKREISSSAFPLHELKEVEILYSRDYSIYIRANTGTTKSNEFITSSRLNPSNYYVDRGYISFCVADIAMWTEIFIRKITIDAIYDE